MADLTIINRGVFFGWFTSVLTNGALRKLILDDLPVFPLQVSSEICKSNFIRTNSVGGSPTINGFDSVDRKKNVGYWKLVVAIGRSFGSALLKTGFLKLLICGMSFSGPLILGEIVTYLEDGVTQENFHNGMILIALLTVCTLVSTALNINYSIRCATLRIGIQATLTRIVFSRSISVSVAQWTELQLSDAQVSNLVQVDVEQIAGCVTGIHDLWALPLQIIVAFTLLYLQIKVAFLAGVAVIVVLIPLNSYIAKRIGANTALWMTEKDSRIKVVTEAFRNITSLKMSGLESCVLRSSQEFRAREVRYLRIRKYLDAVCVFLWASTPVVVPFVTFTSVVLIGQQLSASDVITSIALLNMLIFPMNNFPWVVNGFMEARVSVRRVAHVLLSEDGSELVLRNHKFDICNPVGGDRQSVGTVSASRVGGIHLPASSYSWSRPAPLVSTAELALLDVEAQHLSSEAVTSPLFDANGDKERERFSVEVGSWTCAGGELWAVVGATASGKTALLLGMLKELHCNADRLGQVSVSSRAGRYEEEDGLRLVSSSRRSPELTALDSDDVAGISYCAQVPPMHSGSIRSNILMGSAYDARRYRDVIKGCCLVLDLMASNWTAGDLSDVGVAGSNLSGGQRLRIGLARALYSRNPVVLLDDPFSALDATTGAAVMGFLLETICGTEHRTVILSTHSISLLRDPRVAGIVVLHQGRETARGNYQHLQQVSSEFRDLSLHTGGSGGGDSSSPEKKTATATAVTLSAQDCEFVLDSCLRPAGSEDSVAVAIAQKAMSDLDALAAENEETGINTDSSPGGDESSAQTQKVELMASGRIRSRVYKSYFGAAGVCTVASTVLFTLLMYTASISMALWLAYWATHQGDYSPADFILISSTIAAANLVFAVVRSVLFAKGGLNASIAIYEKLTEAVFHADISFFEQTSVGRLTNRFGKDTNTIDDSLPFIVNILLSMVFLILGGTFVMAYNDPLIIVLLLVVAVLHYRLQRFYRQSSRELRRLDSVYRSPVYTIFTECMSNAPSIRALGAGCVRYFDQQLGVALDNSLRVTLSINIAAQWLGVRLQLLGALINTTLAVMIVINALYNILPVSAGLAGLSLIYSFSIVNQLNSLVNSFAETEQEMISVERVLEYCDLPSEFSDGMISDLKETAAAKKSSWALLMELKLPRLGYKNYNGASYHLEPTCESDVDSELGLGLMDGVADDKEHHVQSKLAHGHLLKTSGIVLSDVCMRYEVNSMDTLRHVSVHIAPGSRVAVVGRTGSGKSSLLRLLLRLNSYHSGSVSFGGQELCQLSKHQLRHSIGVIPQNPLVFTGSVRYNLDPFRLHSEEAVLDALDKCRFLETTLSGNSDECFALQSSALLTGTSKATQLKNLLGLQLVDGGGNLSLGQKQLLCLGRVLLRRSELVLVDEATASVDPATEGLLYEALATQLKALGSTLIMVCHKQHGVHTLCNKVLEMREGEIVSFDEIQQI